MMLANRIAVVKTVVNSGDFASSGCLHASGLIVKVTQ